MVDSRESGFFQCDDDNSTVKHISQFVSNNHIPYFYDLILTRLSGTFLLLKVIWQIQWNTTS